MKASIRQRLQRHPVPVTAFFRHSLVLTYALPREVLQPLLPPGLVLDSLGDHAFLAVAMVQTEALRPAGPFLARSGTGFLPLRLSHLRPVPHGLRGRTLRGLRILRSDTDRRLMAVFGNFLTHYQYRLAKVEGAGHRPAAGNRSRKSGREGDLHVIARLAAARAEFPAGPPFRDWHQARLFAGPLPFTFDYEPATHSIVVIEGVRETGDPRQ